MTFLQKDLYYIDLSKIQNNNELIQIFEDIHKNSNSNGIIVLEDIDCMSEIVLSREKNNENDNTHKELTLSTLLNLLDGTMTKKESIVIMTTNYYDKLDSALVRPGRMDLTIHLTYCDNYQFKSIYKHILNKNLDKDCLELLKSKNITPAQFIYGLLPYNANIYTINQ